MLLRGDAVGVGEVGLPQRGRSNRPGPRATATRGAHGGGGGASGRTRRGAGPPCGRCTTGTTRPRSPTCAVPPVDRGTTWSMFSAAAVAVLAAVPVAREHGPARAAGPGSGTGTRTKWTRRITAGTGMVMRSEWSSAPLRATISAFSFSTSTTARRIGTTQSGSKLALSISALPKRPRPPLRAARPAASLPARDRLRRACPAPLEVGHQVVGARARRRSRTGSRSGSGGSRGPGTGRNGGAAPPPRAGQAGRPARRHAVGQSRRAARSSRVATARRPERRPVAGTGGTVACPVRGRPVRRHSRPVAPPGSPQKEIVAADRAGPPRTRRSAAPVRRPASATSSASSRASASRSTSRSCASSPRATSSSRTSPASARRRWPRRSPRSIGGSWHRIQFTPDLLPSDVTGVSVWNRVAERVRVPARRGLRQHRARRRDQPRVAEDAVGAARGDGGAPGHGRRAHLPARRRPFMVIATQNPIELEGTYPLPEAQLDRFLMRIAMGYPDREAELAILDIAGRATSSVEELTPGRRRGTRSRRGRGAIETRARRRRRCAATSSTSPTRPVEHRDLLLGASPRGALALQRAPRALAASLGRDYVVPDDVKRLAPVVLEHRVLLAPDAAAPRRRPRATSIARRSSPRSRSPARPG